MQGSLISRLHVLILLAGIGAPWSVFADDSGAVDVITVTGTRTAHTIADAPIVTQVITREQIERTTNLDVGRVLDEIPDVYVRQNEQFKLGASTIRMQGADANKVAILLNGRRFRGGIDGIVDLRDIPVDHIERIEVLRGPASSLYGSDAMGGVINIITRPAPERPEASLKIAGGTFGRLFGNATLGGSLGGVEGFLSYSHDELEIAQQYGEFSEQFSGEASDAKQRRDDLFVDLGYAIGARQRIGVTGNYNPIHEGPESRKVNGSVNGTYTWIGRAGTTLDLATGWYGFFRENDLSGFQEDVDYDNVFAEVRATHPMTHLVARETHLMTVGVRFRDEFLVGRTVPGTLLPVDDIDAAASLVSGYVQDEIGLTDSLSLVVGASFDAHEFYGGEANPRAHLTWRPNEWLRFSAGVGRGFRAPDLKQLFDVDANNIVRSGNRITGYVILGNRDLEPETDHGVTFHAGASPWPGIIASLGLFRHEFRDLIEVALLCAGPTLCPGGFENPYPELSGQLYRYENVGAAVTQGGDVSLQLLPFEIFDVVSDHRIEVRLQYGYLHSRNEGDRPGESGNELPFRPPHRFLPSLAHMYVPWGTEVRLGAEYEDRTYADLINSPDVIAESHWLFGAHFRWTPPRALVPMWLSWPGQRDEPFTIFVEGTNLLDAEFGLATAMGRVAGRRMIVGGVQVRL